MAARRARTRRRSPIAARRPSPPRRPARCATSSPAGWSAACSRSGPHITFHEYGRLVMWPYGYTYTNVPSDMTTDDHDALVLIGKKMAATNGYRPEQASDLYITSGTTRDFAYGTYRIFSYTFEMSSKDYPDDSKIATETGRNKEAVLYLIERAWCPLSVLRSGEDDGTLRRLRRRPRGRAAAGPSTRTAPTPRSPRRPAGSAERTRHRRRRRVPKQLGTTTSGSKAYVTGAAAGSSSTAYDLDGRTSIRSRAITVPAGDRPEADVPVRVRPRPPSSTADDRSAPSSRSADGTQSTVFTNARQGRRRRRDLARRRRSALDAWAGQTIRIRFEAVEGGAPNLLEVEIDDVRIDPPELTRRRSSTPPHISRSRRSRGRR